MDAVSLTRRGFLRGRPNRVEPAQRPPWALDEVAFLARCMRCDACLDACPGSILTRGDGGFPKVDFERGECVFCGDCVTQCKSGALFRQEDAAPWALLATVGGACLAMHGVECRVCGEICERSAIRFRPRIGGVALPELDAVSCTGCGACVAPCPAHALTMEKMG
ncbi:ferredoxin-type protein NapF [Pseudothauera nasutitermitis]|uniref:Ferredoxin-type protein NapF n=1 Tax=Pseudothauera nasutitermitis TaxID=2565930 RepID=A0A4S4AN92_9RHOO|nr:ferredoxin-type protein NapF [Pseudothauera nasutitermitis]THF61106.1 ferredoxin-type protein NapF [Pseudothauera nasutitermitis]